VSRPGGFRSWLRPLATACATAAALSALVWGALRAPPQASIPSIEVAVDTLVREIGADGTLRPARATPLSPPTGGPLKIAWAIPNGTQVEAGALVVRFAGNELEKELADGQSDRAAAKVRRDKERALVDSAARGRKRAAELSHVELAQAREFQSKDPVIFSRHQIEAAEIDEGLSLLRAEHADAAKGIESSLSRHRIALLGVDSKRAELAIARAQQGLSGLELRAPHGGLVVFSDNGRGQPFQVGDSVWAGQTLATLPSLDSMEAIVHVLEADAGGIAVGQAATLVVQAHPGMLHAAKIKSIDALARELVPASPTQYYGVTLELTRTDPALMKPGARVHADLRTAPQRGIIVPRQALFETSSGLVAYVERGGRFEPALVRVGPISLGRALVLSGLSAGDRIALVDPTAKPSADKPADGAGALREIGR
jgi:HlyD family secretion protein